VPLKNVYFVYENFGIRGRAYTDYGLLASAAVWSGRKVPLLLRLLLSSSSMQKSSVRDA